MARGDVDPHRGSSAEAGERRRRCVALSRRGRARAAPRIRGDRRAPRSARRRSAPSDVENTAAQATPAASRSASTTPATPSAATIHIAISARVANRGTSRSAIRHVDATPTMPIKPMKNSQRPTTARTDGGGDTTDLAACALALAAETPDTERVRAGREMTVDLRDRLPRHRVHAVADGLERYLQLEGWPGTATVGPASTLTPELLTTVMLDRRGSGVSPKVISTNFGAVWTSEPSGGTALCGSACAAAVSGSTKTAAAASVAAQSRAVGPCAPLCAPAPQSDDQVGGAEQDCRR